MPTPTLHPALKETRVTRHHFAALGLAWRGATPERPGGPLAILAAATADADAPEPKVEARAITFKSGGAAGDDKTADWHWDPARGHVIRIHTGVRKVATGIPATAARSLVTRRYRAMIREIIRHEAAHGHWSERNGKMLAEECRRLAVPFRLWNLFEDVRIEHLERAARGLFRWARYCLIESATSDPVSWIFAWKQREGGSIHAAWTGAAATKKCAPALTTLARLFTKATKAPDSFAVVKIAAEFLEHFDMKSWPGGVPVPDRIGDGETYDGEPLVVEPTGPSDLLDPGASDAAADGRRAPTPGTSGTWHRSPRTADSVGESRGELSPYLFAYNPPDPVLTRELAAKLARIVRMVGERPGTLTEDGSRLYLPSYAAGDPDCWLSRSPAPDAPRLVLIVDMSGSMQPLWTSHGGRELVHAFRLLARTGRAHVRFWFTGHGAGGVRLSPHESDDAWNKLYPGFGAEDYVRTLRKCEPDLRWARLAVCFSDADLTDGDVDVALYRAKGIDLCGCCIGPADALALFAEQQRKNFGRSVVDSSAPGLASQLAVALSRRR